MSQESNCTNLGGSNFLQKFETKLKNEEYGCKSPTNEKFVVAFIKLSSGFHQDFIKFAFNLIKKLQDDLKFLKCEKTLNSEMEHSNFWK